jgi:hypothetical protein
MIRKVLILVAALLLCGVVRAESVIFDAAGRPGISVFPRLIGVHSIGLLEAIPGWDIFESDFNYKIGLPDVWVVRAPCRATAHTSATTRPTSKRPVGSLPS